MIPEDCDKVLSFAVATLHAECRIMCAGFLTLVRIHINRAHIFSRGLSKIHALAKSAGRELSLKMYGKGMDVFYSDANGTHHQCTVVEVHLDDLQEPYYTIRFKDGREKQTDNKHLTTHDFDFLDEVLYNDSGKGLYRAVVLSNDTHPSLLPDHPTYLVRILATGKLRMVHGYSLQRIVHPGPHDGRIVEGYCKDRRNSDHSGSISCPRKSTQFGSKHRKSDRMSGSRSWDGTRAA